jgi:hypothetical protein
MSRVRVHWNLHRGGYSVTVRGKVTATPDAVCLRNVRFVVSDAGLARMRRLGRRKVVAWAEGELCACAPGATHDGPTVTFNPWRGDRFTVRETGAVIEGATHVAMTSGVGADGKAFPLATVLA